VFVGLLYSVFTPVQLLLLPEPPVHSPEASLFPYLQELREGDRRNSNPRPSEPQSADFCF
jgi:hypothetical protein